MIELPLLQGTKIGTIDLKKGELQSDKENPIHFDCKITGRCCKRNQIPITAKEIAKIKESGYYDFVSDFPPVWTPEGETFWMKRNNESCVFLNQKMCEIHFIKPFSCKVFPFQIVPTGFKKYDLIVSETNTCDNVKKTNLEDSNNEDILKFIYNLIESIPS